MHTLHAFVQNLPMYGAEITVKPDGSCIRNVMRVTHGSNEFVLRQSEDFLKHLHKSGLPALLGASVETTLIEVAGVSEGEQESVLTKITSLCWLLSFASQSLVACYGHSYPANSGTKKQATHGEINARRPVIDINDPEQLVRFAKITFNGYLAIEQERKLRSVIHYLHEAGLPSRPLEVSIVLLFVALENLKHTYAVSVGYRFVGGVFREQNGKTKINFESMCGRLFDSVGMNPNLAPLVSLRNDVIHSGLTGLTPQAQQSHKAELSDLIREYILRLIGYNGSYMSHGFGHPEVRNMS
jgi:hypothetical protein